MYIIRKEVGRRFDLVYIPFLVDISQGRRPEVGIFELVWCWRDGLIYFKGNFSITRWLYTNPEEVHTWWINIRTLYI